MPKTTAVQPSKGKRVAKPKARRVTKAAAERRQIAAVFDVAAFQATMTRTAAATATEWAKPY